MDKRGITANLKFLQTQAQQYDEILFSQREKSTFNSTFNSKNNFKGKKKFYEIEKKDKKQVNEVKQAEKKDVTCYNCQKKGHIAKDC